MNDRYALINGVDVVSVIKWNGDFTYSIPDGFELVEAPIEVGPGWKYDNGEWVAPPSNQEVPDF